MSKDILVTGGTGTLGRVVVQKCVDEGLRPTAFSRRPTPGAIPGARWVTGDLLRGSAIDDAMNGASVIVHCATNGRRPVDDVKATRRLIDAARTAGSPHLIYVSIVGCDRIPLKYYRYKHGIEGIVQRSGLPWTVQRITQFHDLIATILGVAGRLPIMPLPSRTSLQPIDTTDAATRLVEIAVGEARGRATDLGGPRVEGIQDLARQYLRANRKRRVVGSVRYPGAVAGGYRAGHHLTPEHADGVITFRQYLGERRLS